MTRPRPHRVPVTRYRLAPGRIRALADRYYLAELYGVSPRTVRRRCPVAEYDKTTGAALYDNDIVARLLAPVRPRPPRSDIGRRIRARMST